MPSTVGWRPRAIDAAVVEFLVEFAHYLVAAGITNRRFISMMRIAYFLAAAKNAKFGNERLNQSAVAAMTGLTRLQVRQFAKMSKPEPQELSDRLENVVEGWSSDSSFLTSRGSPRSLRIVGRGLSFGSLARKYGGDLPSRSLLRELQRQGYVTVRHNQVSLRKSVSRSRSDTHLARLSSALANLLRQQASGDANVLSLRTMNLEVRYPVASEKGRILLQKRTMESLKAFMERVRASGISASLDSPPRAREQGRLTRTRVVLLTEDLEANPIGKLR